MALATDLAWANPSTVNPWCGWYKPSLPTMVSPCRTSQISMIEAVLCVLGRVIRANPLTITAKGLFCYMGLLTRFNSRSITS